MNLKLKNTPEQVELIKAMGSRNQLVSREAQEAFAAFLGPVVQQVLLSAGTASTIYSDVAFDEDDNPSYPLDLFYDEQEGYVSVWSQSMAGGLPTSEVTGVSELKLSTYRLDSAVSFNKRYARRSRLDVISKAVERLANEVLIKQERNAWAVIAKALVDGTSSQSEFASGANNAVRESDASMGRHLFSTSGSATGDFNVHILNLLLQKHKRMNESFAGGTPVAPYSAGITDLYLSPEIMGTIRSWAYNPVKHDASSSMVAGGQKLPDNVRDDIWSAGGAPEIWGITLNELMELGLKKKYSALVDHFGNGISFNNVDNLATSTDFDSDSDELIIGIDRSRGAFIRPVARNADSGSTFAALPDDQWNLNRLDKAGFYGSMEEGRVCLDSRAIIGLAHTKAGS